MSNIVEFKREISRFIEVTGKEVIIQELKKINPSQVIVDKVDKLFQQNFKPIIKKVVDYSITRVSKRINDRLKQVINLKTSTIMEVQEEVRKIPTESEESSLKQLSEDFPEYYEQIDKDNK